MSDRSRRAVLGTTGVALATALAGCNDIFGGGGDGSPTPTEGEPGDGGTETEGETPVGTETETGTADGATTPRQQQTPTGGPKAVNEWLTEDTVGGAAGNYDGEFADKTGEDTVEIAVGAEGNGGAYAFDPPAVVVDAGTEVQWQWTGEGGPHNVEAKPDEQYHTSDYEFSSGQPESGSDVTFSQTLDKSGVALYHCDERLSAGMKGGIVIE